MTPRWPRTRHAREHQHLLAHPRRDRDSDRVRLHRLKRRRRVRPSTGRIPQIDRSRGYHGLRLLRPGRAALRVRSRRSAVQSSTSPSRSGVCSDICVPATAKLHAAAEFRRRRTRRSRSGSTRRWRRRRSCGTSPASPSARWKRVSTARCISSVPTLRSTRPASSPMSATRPSSSKRRKKARMETIWTLKPLGGAGRKGLEGSSVQLTFQTPMGPYAVTAYDRAEPALAGVRSKTNGNLQ